MLVITSKTADPLLQFAKSGKTVRVARTATYVSGGSNYRKRGVRLQYWVQTTPTQTWTYTETCEADAQGVVSFAGTLLAALLSTSNPKIEVVNVSGSV